MWSVWGNLVKLFHVYEIYFFFRLVLSAYPEMLINPEIEQYCNFTLKA